MENNELLVGLSKLFLNIRDPDESYCKMIRVIKRLNNRGIGISMKEVQRKAYKCGEVEKWVKD